MHRNVEYFYTMAVHVGKLVKKKYEEQGMRLDAFAKKLSKSRHTVYDIFERESIDTELLKTISEALQYNFFLDLANQQMLIDNFTPGSVRINAVAEPQTDYGTNYKEKYFTLLEKYAEMQEVNFGSYVDMLKGYATRNEAFQELIMDALAEHKKLSIEAVHASLGRKIFEALSIEKTEGIQTD